MGQTDLYSLLRGYAINSRSVVVGIRQFLNFASQYASRKLQEEPDLARWAIDAETEFRREVPSLVENGRCVIIADSRDGDIFLPEFCREIIKSTYQDPDKPASIPFPGAANMKLKIPAGYTRAVGVISDMEYFFDRKVKINPDEIITLNFPQEYGNALMLAAMLPRKLMELALLKIHYFLNSGNGHNMAHIYNTLTIQIKGKERLIKDFLDRLLSRPLDCLNDIERLDDFAYIFWVHFCSLVKNDIKSKNEIRSEDLAVMQATYVIEVCINLYRSSVVKKKEINAAFNRLEELMNNPPFRYTLGDIIKFTNEQGSPLLDFYSQEELETYIRNKITETKDGALTLWLTIQGAGIEDRWYFRKERYLPICAKMLSEARPQIKDALEKRWKKLIREYFSEPAMEKDLEYEKLLKKLTNNANPALLSVLADSKLVWAYQELETSLGTVPQALRLFNKGMLLPFNVLYALGRRDVLADIKADLPFWYSNPLILAILMLFKRKKGPVPADDDKPSASGKKNSKMKDSALKIQSVIVPEGKNPDDYLEALEERWSSLRDADTRKTMIVGVKSLLKDNLRKNIKIRNLQSIKRDDLRAIAEELISKNSTLARLKDQEALRKYMELYMIKLLR
jgi:hypothetical protein